MDARTGSLRVHGDSLRLCSAARRSAGLVPNGQKPGAAPRTTQRECILKQHKPCIKHSL